MIKIQTLDRIANVEYIVIPTIFPDNTSQVWKLPKEIIDSLNVKVTWNFEAERELIDLLSLRILLLEKCNIHLHIPYLPYARQDKKIDNNSTFNLDVFSTILNQGKFNLVTSVDVHNVKTTNNLIENFRNLTINNLIEKSLNYIPTDYIAYPDFGAHSRYKNINKSILFEKNRDQSTGKILGHRLESSEDLNRVNIAKRILIVDDICDGGATFISIAKMLKEINPNLNIDLYVTHGIFSKGKKVLHDSGIENIYTTNSLLKNTDGFKV